MKLIELMGKEAKSFIDYFKTLDYEKDKNVFLSALMAADFLSQPLIKDMFVRPKEPTYEDLHHNHSEEEFNRKVAEWPNWKPLFQEVFYTLRESYIDEQIEKGVTLDRFLTELTTSLIYNPEYDYE